MIRTLDRYLIKNFVLNYAMALFVLISLYVVLDLFINLDEFTETGGSAASILGNVVDYYGYNLPLYFSQLSGIITLFAACATLARLQRHNEITAILASGTSLYRVATPIVVAGLAMNALLWIDHEYVLPQIASKLARQRDDVQGERVHDVWFVKDDVESKNSDIDRRLLCAQKFSPTEGLIGGLIVVERNRQGEIEKLILAKTARWGTDPDADTSNGEKPRHGWILELRGREIAVGPSVGEDTGKAFVPVARHFYASSLSPSELLLRKSAQWLSMLSLDQLERLRERGVANAEDVARVRHSRFTMPISNMVLLLLGISFFMSRLPESVLTQGAKALATCGLAFVTVFVGQQRVGTADWMPLSLPYWLPIFIFGPIAVLLLDNVKT